MSRLKIELSPKTDLQRLLEHTKKRAREISEREGNGQSIDDLCYLIENLAMILNIHFETGEN